MARVPAGEIEALVEGRVRALLREPARRACDASAPAERAHRLRALLRRVVIGADAATIEVARHEDFRRPESARGRADTTDAVRDNGDGFTIRCRIRLRCRGGERIIEPSDGVATIAATRPDRALIKAVVRAHAWREALEQGTVSSTADLAARAGCHVRYVRNLLKLGYLAPDLVDAILAGRQRLRLSDLVATDLPLTWAQQKAM